MFVSLTRWNANRSYLLQTAYLIFEVHFKLFFQQFPWVLQLWRFFIKWYQQEWSIKLRIDNDGWHKTLNLLHVSRWKMLHFVTSDMKQNKSHKQSLESAQSRLGPPTSSPGVPFVMHWKLGPLARSNDILVLNGFVNTIDRDQNQSDLLDLTLSMRRVTASP